MIQYTKIPVEPRTYEISDFMPEKEDLLAFRFRELNCKRSYV